MSNPTSPSNTKSHPTTTMHSIALKTPWMYLKAVSFLPSCSTIKFIDTMELFSTNWIKKKKLSRLYWSQSTQYKSLFLKVKIMSQAITTAKIKLLHTVFWLILTLRTNNSGYRNVLKVGSSTQETRQNWKNMLTQFSQKENICSLKTDKKESNISSQISINSNKVPSKTTLKSKKAK